MGAHCIGVRGLGLALILPALAAGQKAWRHPIYREPLEVLTARAAEELRITAEGIRLWAGKVRPADGTPGRFRWAVDARRPAEVASTLYVLMALRGAGLTDQVITARDRAAGVAWVRSLDRGGGVFRDPAFETPGGRLEDAQQEVISRYARHVLKEYGVQSGQIPDSPPPPGWPQLSAAPAEAVPWIKERLKQGQGSWAASMMRWLFTWHVKGKLPMDPLLESLRHVYSIQDPETGLWGSPGQDLQGRINWMTYKLFTFFQFDLDLPLPHARRIIDTIIDQRLLKPEYDREMGGCDEFDNWYVLAIASEKAPGHRRDELRKLAAHRIILATRQHRTPDGGLSYSRGRCATNLVGFEMCPAKHQGDALGLATLVNGLTLCVEILGLEGKTSWRNFGIATRPARTSPEIIRMRRRIERLLALP